MKHSLQLKLSQHLTLTPQLQQSIRLLQLSTLELNQEIERFLQDNPLLERDEGTVRTRGLDPRTEVLLYFASRAQNVWSALSAAPDQRISARLGR